MSMNIMQIRYNEIGFRGNESSKRPDTPVRNAVVAAGIALATSGTGCGVRTDLPSTEDYSMYGGTDTVDISSSGGASSIEPNTGGTSSIKNTLEITGAGGNIIEQNTGGTSRTENTSEIIGTGGTSSTKPQICTVKHQESKVSVVMPLKEERTLEDIKKYNEAGYQAGKDSLNGALNTTEAYIGTDENGNLLVDSGLAYVGGFLSAIREKHGDTNTSRFGQLGHSIDTDSDGKINPFELLAAKIIADGQGTLDGKITTEESVCGVQFLEDYSSIRDQHKNILTFLEDTNGISAVEDLRNNFATIDTDANQILNEPELKAYQKQLLQSPQRIDNQPIVEFLADKTCTEQNGYSANGLDEISKKLENGMPITMLPLAINN